MRSRATVMASAALLLLGGAGCARHPQAGRAAAPHRRSGLWQETIARDGKASPLGPLKICLDAATDERLGVFGREAAQGACPSRAATRRPGGWAFASTCDLGKAGKVSSKGVATGDFDSAYTIATVSTVQGAALGAANGVHHTVIEARWLGPCPPDMAPGDAAIGDLRVNVDRLAAGAAALGVQP